MSKRYISVDAKGKNYYVTFYDDRGIKRKVVDSDYLPSCYVGSDSSKLIENKDGLIKKEFEKWYDLKQFSKNSALPTYGAPNVEADYIVNNFGDDNTKLTFRKDNYNIVYFDIETKTENGFPDTNVTEEEITLLVFIAPYRKQGKKNFIYTTFNYTGGQFDGDDFELKMFNDESTMLKEVVELLEALSPDFLCGHNSDIFDIPYISGRVLKLLGKSWYNRLSPFDIITKSTQSVFDKDYPVYEWVGLPTIDFMLMSKKYIHGDRPSWSLDSIAEDYLGEKKIQNPGRSFKEFYTGTYDIKEKPSDDEHPALRLAHKRYTLKRKGINTHDKEAQRYYRALDTETKKQAINLFVEYGYRDVLLLVRLADVTGFIDLAGTIMYLMRCNMRDVYGTVKQWENKIYSYLHSKGIVPFINNKPTPERQSYAGGYVKDTIVGMFEWMYTGDYSSLYPSLIRTYNMSPETYVGKSGIYQGIEDFNLIKKEEDLSFLKANNLAMGANGAMFVKNVQGFIPQIVELLFKGRQDIKKTMLNNARDIEVRKTKIDNVDLSQVSLMDIERELKRRG